VVNNELLSDSFSICATASITAACVIYFFQVRSGQSVPNRISWIVWVLVGFLNTPTYYHVVGNNVIMQVMVIVHATLLAAILLYSWAAKKFSEFVRRELVFCLWGVIALGLFWLVFRKHGTTNVLLQAISIVSFWPTIDGLRMGRATEKSFSWCFSVAAYVFLALANALDPRANGMVVYVFPVTRGALCAYVIYLAGKTRRKSRTESFM